MKPNKSFSKSKIKPCPWCSGKRIECTQINELTADGKVEIVSVCRKCGASSPIGKVPIGQGVFSRIEEEGINLWNARKVN